MASINVKLTTSIATIGALSVGGLGYGIYTYSSTVDTLRNYLINNSFEIVDEKDGAFWTKVLATYQLEKTSETAIQTKEITNPNVIRDWCKDNLKLNIQSTKDDLFKKASKWCVEYSTIEEIMQGTYEKDTAKLASKYDSLEGEVRKLIDAISDVSGSNLNGEKIKKWCEINKKRRFFDDNDEEFFSSNLVQICSTDNNG